MKQIPPEIASSLKKVLARVRKIQLLKGVLATGAALLFSIMGVMIIDWAFNIQVSAIRWALSLTALLITLATAWRYLLRPLMRRISLITIARWLENHHPEMQERISTAVELGGRGDAGSQGLIDEVVKEAVVDAGK